MVFTCGNTKLRLCLSGAIALIRLQFSAMNAVRVLTRRAFQWRRLSTHSALFQIPAVGPATPTEPLSIPVSEGVDRIYSPKLEKIALDISNLNLVEVSELSQLLKKKLNLPDQPMMPMGAFAFSGAASESADEETGISKKIQTEFTVKLTGFDESQKIALIKEVKNSLEGYNLVQAKKFIETLPAMLKKDISKEEAENLKNTFTKVGAQISIE